MREVKLVSVAHTSGGWVDTFARPNDDWSSKLIQHQGAKGVSRFKAALTHPHKLHLFVGGGFDAKPYSEFRSLGGNTPCLGGENGLMTDIADAKRKEPNSAWGTEAAIKQFWKDDIDDTRVAKHAKD